MEKNKTRDLVFTAMLVSLTVIMMFTPLGTLRLPMVSVTIAHIPAIVAAIVLGLWQGVAVAFVFGLISLFIALTTPTGVLDPFFVNPLISILPRVLIPVTTYFVYKALSGRFNSKFAVGISAVVGNLTNTFGVYAMLYLLYAKPIYETTGIPAFQYILGAISVSTLIKTIIVTLIVTPLVFALKKIIKNA
ncbi:MAG: ECF transporter S component [Erysipelothrix sp.]